MGVLAGHWLRTAKEGNQKSRYARRGLASIALATSGASTSRQKEDLDQLLRACSRGWSLLLLATFYWLIDVKGWTKWTFFFV